MANIRDVAKKAGVGIATVSRYINQDGYVSEAVGEKIQAAIDELNYKPNALARALFTKSSKMIGLIIPNIVNPFYPELAVGVENRAKEKGYSIVLSNTEYSKQNEASFIDMFLQHRVDGIIVANAKCDKEYINAKIPIISIEKRIDDSITYVSSDNKKGGRLVAEYMIEKGFKRILHIKGPEDIESANDRYLSFAEKLQEQGIQVDVLEGIYGEDFSNIGQTLKNYEAVFVWNDDLSISILSECYHAGLKVPEDIEVIGYDNIFFSRKTIPALTTVNQSIGEMGEAAVDLIIDQIENGKSAVKEKIFDVELVKRDTTSQ